MYDIVFTILWLRGNLVYFHILAILYNAVMNIVEHVPCGVIENPLGIFPRGVMLVLEVLRFPIFGETTILIFEVTVQIPF